MRKYYALVMSVILLVPLMACQSVVPIQPKKNEELRGSLVVALYGGETYHLKPYLAGTVDKKMPIHDRIAEFAEQHPNVQIEIVDFRPGSYELKQLLQQPERLPDIIEMNVNEARHIARDRITSLAEWIEPVRAKWEDGGYAAVIASAAIDGEPYLLPVRSDPMAAYYDRIVLRNLGIPEPDENWTLSEFAEIAAKLADAGESVGIPFDLNSVEHIVQSFGGTYTAPDGRIVGYLDSRETAAAFARYFGMMPDGHYTIGTQVGDPFLEIPPPAFGMARASSLYRPVRTIGKNYALLPAPAPDEGGRVNTSILTGLAMSKEAEDPALAWALMEHIAGETGEGAMDFLAANTLETAYRMVRDEPDPRYDQLKEWMKTDYVDSMPASFDMYMEGALRFYGSFPVQLMGRPNAYDNIAIVQEDLSRLAVEVESWIDAWKLQPGDSLGPSQ